MAQAANKRPGFSRRAQYGLFLGYVVAVAGILVAILMLVVAALDPRGFAAIKGAALDLTAPVSSAGRSGVRGVAGIGDAIGNYFRAGSQNAQLKSELESARRELVQAAATRAENAALRRLLGLAREVQDEVTLARVVGSSFDSPRRFATLSAGSEAGVRAGQPVRSPDGLLGRVLETGRWASRILLVSDGASSVPVRAVRTGVAALAAGRGDGLVDLRTLELGVNPFRLGDMVVTSGVGGIFPPGVPVAVVVGRQGDTAIARPLADPSRSDFAIVQPIYQPAVNGSLEDAPPTSPIAPVSAPPLAPGVSTPPARQHDPRYQPALQEPNPNAPRMAPPRPPAGTPAAGPRQ
jgi:rod shape-determining protein MreC